jgi:hypothetical protein
MEIKYYNGNTISKKRYLNNKTAYIIQTYGGMEV